MERPLPRCFATTMPPPPQAGIGPLSSPHPSRKRPGDLRGRLGAFTRSLPAVDEQTTPLAAHLARGPAARARHAHLTHNRYENRYGKTLNRSHPPASEHKRRELPSGRAGHTSASRKTRNPPTPRQRASVSTPPVSATETVPCNHPRYGEGLGRFTHAVPSPIALALESSDWGDSNRSSCSTDGAAHRRRAPRTMGLR